MEAAGRGGIPREEVANSQFGVPISASPQAAVGARSTLTASLREDYRCLPPPIGSTIMKTATGSVRPDNPRWGGRSCRTRRALHRRRALDSDEGGARRARRKGILLTSIRLS